MLNEEKCVFGCIFEGDRLYGDCRVPWADECEMNKRTKELYGEEKGEDI